MLKTTDQDPTPLVDLSIKLLAPLSFARARQLVGDEDLLAALRSLVPGQALLALAVVHKAAASPEEAAYLVELPGLLDLLLTCCLCCPDVGVAQKAVRVLGDLFEADCDADDAAVDVALVNGVVNGHSASQDMRRPARRNRGSGALWARLDELGTLHIIISCCSREPQGRPYRDVTLSQHRLLDLLTRLSALNIFPITRTVHADVFPGASSNTRHHGLLFWATSAMIDRRDGVMHRVLVGFFERFVSIMRVAGRSETHRRVVQLVVHAAAAIDDDLHTALTSLPGRTVESEAEPLQQYIYELFAGTSAASISA